MVEYFIDFDNIPTPCETYTDASKTVIEKIGDGSTRTVRCLPVRKSYKQTYSIADLEKQLLSFYEMEIGSSMSAFCKCHTTIPKSTFHRHFKESGLADLQAQEKHVDMAKATLGPYFIGMEKNQIKRMEAANKANCYLTDQQELAIVQIAKLLGSMGEGITRLDIHRMILEILNLEEDK